MRVRGGVALLLIVAVAATVQYFRPIPAVTAAAALPRSEVVPGTPPTLPWPARGAAAVGVPGLGVIASSGTEQAIPAASVTKVMTALVLLLEAPLQVGGSGPVYTVTDADVQAYQADLALGQSVARVEAGEQLTEMRLLQGMLIPSANNYAEMVARWNGAGSIETFVAKMNARAAALKMTHTHFADPAGASPQSVSTPTDLLILGMVAMKDPAFASVVAMPQVDLPVAGTVYNVNAALGQNGIVGVKTGSGLNAGANFLFASSQKIDGRDILVMGCVMGQPTLSAAFASAQNLSKAMSAALHVKRVIERNETVGTYMTAWGPQVDVISLSDVDLVEWPGMVLRQRLDSPTLNVDHPLPSNTHAGLLHLALGDYSVEVEVATASALYPPGRLWRLTRVAF